MLSWMAWTWPTALIFIGIALSIGLMAYLEVRNPGGAERDGILGLTTTRGDRLFLTILGAAWINLAWLGFFGAPLWGAIVVCVLWGIFCFRKV